MKISVRPLGSCVPHRRIDPPAPNAPDAIALIARLQRETGTVRLDVFPDRIAVDAPAAASILVRLGYLRRQGRRLQPTAMARRVVSRETFDTYSNRGDVPIGTQRVIGLTFADVDRDECSAVSDAYDEYGYVARVTSLNDLGRALLAAHLLEVGYLTSLHSAYPMWNGRSAIDGALGFNHQSETFTVRRGEVLGLATSFYHI